MTTPRAAIVFNNSTGSDTAASGLGPATAVSGSAAAHTNGAASTTITLTNTPDLSGVVAGDLLWLNTGSGRQYSVISAVDNGADTVTVDDSFNIASGSAVDYAIGGKRATFAHADSAPLFVDAKPLWEIETETDQSITVGIVCSADGASAGKITLRGSAGAKRVITQSSNDECLDISGDLWCFENFKLQNTNGTKTAAYGARIGVSLPTTFRDCVFGDATNRLQSAYVRVGGFIAWIILVDCCVEETASHGIDGADAVATKIECYGTVVRNAQSSSHGIRHVGSSGGRIHLHDCVIYGNAGDGVSQSVNGDDIRIVGCTIHGNGGDGVELSSAGIRSAVILNNNITGNGGWGINAGGNHAAVLDHNNYGTGATANTSGAVTGTDEGPNDLHVDPGYADAANGNFECGTNVKAQGFPDSALTVGANQSATNSYVDIGAAQRQEPAGGGGSRAALIGA